MIILFDGVCNLCTWSVQFIIKRDPKEQFSFASLQSDVGKSLLEKHHLSDVNSVVLIKKNKCYLESNAALEICHHLSNSWKLLTILKIIPSFIRNPLYRYIARNRYKWFGKQESCMLPTEEMKKRFL